MADLQFSVEDMVPERYALTPLLNLRLRITDRDGGRVHAMALRCQIRIEPFRRGYDAAEAERLADPLARQDLVRRPRRLGESLAEQAEADARVPEASAGLARGSRPASRGRRRRRRPPTDLCAAGVGSELFQSSGARSAGRYLERGSSSETSARRTASASSMPVSALVIEPISKSPSAGPPSMRREPSRRTRPATSERCLSGRAGEELLDLVRRR